MKLFIPEIGTLLRLTADWVFYLHYEGRNEGLLKFFELIVPNSNQNSLRRGLLVRADGTADRWGHWDGAQAWRDGIPTHHATQVTLPAGTELILDRIYIRKGKDAFSSVTFRTVVLPGTKSKPRFWAKLADVNTLEVELFDVPVTAGGN